VDKALDELRDYLLQLIASGAKAIWSNAMMPSLLTLSPRQTFEDNMRPAQLLLRVYRLLDANDVIMTEGEMVTSLRSLVQASAGEDLMLVYNELFLGLVRERAQIPRSTLRQVSLCHLLRQAVVASCTALETYLPALLAQQFAGLDPRQGA
jgi:hypothetical protein